jgi:hypothetical protein
MNGTPVVYDRINGYALGRRSTADEARRAAASVNNTPAAPEQKSSAFVGEDEGFHRVDAALAGNEAAASAAAC